MTSISQSSNPTDVESWYEKLQDYTFPTYFVSISQLEAQAIVDSYDDQRHFSDKISSSEEKQNALIELAQKIQVLIDKCNNRGAFVRLSTRSPKDVALKRKEHVKTLLEKELHDISAGDDVGKQIIAIVRCAARFMRVETGKEAVDNLCLSERAYQDLFRRLLESDESNWNISIVVREWVPINPELEFRGFVSKGQFTGLTQYYKTCYVPEIAQKKKEIQKAIVTLFEQIKHLIPLESYVIDFAYHENKAIVVELNPFGPSASPALFNWATDNEVLNNGPFEFRILKKVPKDVKSQIAKPLRDLIGWDEEDLKDNEKSCIIS